MLPFEIGDLQAAIRDGRVTARDHPTLPLHILNYSPEVQYTNYWDDVTLNCRGLIVHDDYSIVARPWKKFFNLGQVNLPIQFDDPVEVMDKADGSLGILYPRYSYDGSWGANDDQGQMAIATRGSFTSEQAIKATQIWNEKYAELHNQEAFGGGDYTYLFEIVYPQNRIVLDYGDTEDLILLGAVHNGGGYYHGPREAASYLDWTGPVVEVMPYKSISEALGHTDRPNAEGYVIRSHNFMVKVKQPDYIELHRLVTNASPKTVWEQLKIGKSKAEIVSAFPDEFHDYIGGMIDPLIYAYGVRLEEISKGFWRARGKVELGETLDGPLPTRKDYAKEFSKHKDARYYFLMLDGKPVRDVLWTELKPTAE